MSRETLPSGTEIEVVTAAAPVRGVVIAPDIMGLRPLFDDHVARLSAKHSWAVAAVEPYPGKTDLPLDERLSGRIDVERMLYPEADHGFVHDASRDTHRAEDAADAWTRVAAFLA